MLLFIFRLATTVVYALIGEWLALPLSYFFQGSIYNEMSFSNYLSGGFSSISIGASFGAFEVYRVVLIVSVIGTVVIGKLIEHFLLKKR